MLVVRVGWHSPPISAEDRIVTPLSGPVADVLHAQKAVTLQKIDVAVARQAQDATRQAGEAVNSLLEQVVLAQKQISQGRLDVRA